MDLVGRSVVGGAHLCCLSGEAYAALSQLYKRYPSATLQPEAQCITLEEVDLNDFLRGARQLSPALAESVNALFLPRTLGASDYTMISKLSELLERFS